MTLATSALKIGVAELLLPAVRWDPHRGFAGEREGIERGLARGVGGFIFFGGPQDEVRALIKDLRFRSRRPLMFAADLERGAGQQFAGATGLPPLAAIASLNDEEAIRRAAKLTAREARTLGINWNYAPVVDLDVVPQNPIVGTRAFGGDPARVGKLATAWIEACQREGVLACAKHFPGHGRTTGDSHATLPVVDATRAELMDGDLVPFRAAIASGVASIMTAHVAYPALDPSGVPATLSRDILRLLLREKLGFKDGLIVTDALIMAGVLGEGAEGAEGEAAVRALDAGCDLILYPRDFEGVAAAIDAALRNGRLDEDRVYWSLRRRLKWAQWASPPTDYRRATAADVAWAAQLAERVISVVRGTAPTLSGPVELMIVDDDVGGPHPAPSRDPLVETLRAHGCDLGVVADFTRGVRGQPLVAVFGDIRAWKGRPGYSEATRAAVRGACEATGAVGRQAVVVQFSHPRLAAELPFAETVVCAWGGERAMQEAAARWLAKRR
ncbi:MAG TPA: glycoside hydrolase family 3 N-terminal domain-containing protein [Gemmatimonadaceae bacterium]|nr:glycoside hydrolase family 3 N-terminal domain-containing protein [Gemmatimonadaceae bacterium]